MFSRRWWCFDCFGRCALFFFVSFGACFTAMARGRGSGAAAKSRIIFFGTAGEEGTLCSLYHSRCPDGQSLQSKSWGRSGGQSSLWYIQDTCRCCEPKDSFFSSPVFEVGLSGPEAAGERNDITCIFEILKTNAFAREVGSRTRHGDVGRSMPTCVHV